MKTILLSLALGALFFAGSLRVVETRAEPARRIVEAPPPPLIPAAPPGVIGVDYVEEPLESYIFSRAEPRKKKLRMILKQDPDSPRFSRYAPPGLDAEAPPPPPRID